MIYLLLDYSSAKYLLLFDYILAKHSDTKGTMPDFNWGREDFVNYSAHAQYTFIGG